MRSLTVMAKLSRFAAAAQITRLPSRWSAALCGGTSSFVSVSGIGDPESTRTLNPAGHPIPVAAQVRESALALKEGAATFTPAGHDYGPCFVAPAFGALSPRSPGARRAVLIRKN
jgi:hypothetical protein